MKGISQDLYPKFLWSDEYGFHFFYIFADENNRNMKII